MSSPPGKMADSLTWMHGIDPQPQSKASVWHERASQGREDKAMKVTKVLAAAALIASGVAGCASTDEAMPAASPGHELHTFAPGWQRFFTLDWQAGQRSGRTILSGAVQPIRRYGHPRAAPGGGSRRQGRRGQSTRHLARRQYRAVRDRLFQCGGRAGG